MIDLKAFFHMSYGLYLISSRDGDAVAGCTVNTLSQVTAEPVRMTVAVNKDKNAPVFKQCDYGIVGDVKDVLPKLVAAL